MALSVVSKLNSEFVKVNRGTGKRHFQLPFCFAPTRLVLAEV